MPTSIDRNRISIVQPLLSEVQRLLAVYGLRRIKRAFSPLGMTQAVFLRS